MDLVNGVLNWVGTPVMVASLLLFYPPYYLFKTCYSFLSYLLITLVDPDGVLELCRLC